MPDPRHSLANERTFLAWVRTGLTMIATGLGIDAFAGESLPTGLRVAAAVVLLLLGGLCGVVAVRRWAAVEEAIRTGREHRRLGITPVVSYAVAVLAVVLAAVLVVRG